MMPACTLCGNILSTWQARQQDNAKHLCCTTALSKCLHCHPQMHLGAYIVGTTWGARALLAAAAATITHLPFLTAGLFCVMFSLIAAVGISQLQFTDMNSPR